MCGSLFSALSDKGLGGDNCLGRSLTIVLAGGEELEAA
ncbi:hypothetical protein R69658_08224 [Paraburkholderia aspalathi]|uniref:Uncharacterized protein n=1 Tax=Paraburkholderia aspalathi TaxID=1324617 RepID=A0ABN7NAE1_9BURK|nr:hypothetical protein R69658_08224 [Paraburkholderia aspalathi]